MRHSYSVKAHLRELARLLSDDGRGAEILGLIQAVASEKNRPPPEPDDSYTQKVSYGRHQTLSKPPSSNGNLVGIWERCGQGEGFIRSEKWRREWDFWADCENIPPKGEKHRVIFLGESVARGWNYSVEPAEILEHILNWHQGPVEVIDLARISLTLSGMSHVISQVNALQPDSIVLFGGNNWFTGVAQDSECLDILRARGLPSLKSYVENYVTNQARDLIFAPLESLASAANIPVVCTIPAYNLLDWRDPSSNCTPLLEHDECSAWVEHRNAAEQALDAGDLSSARENAEAMLALDNGTSRAGYYMLAQCMLHDGENENSDIANAKTYFESALEVFDGGFILNAPARCHPFIAEFLREESKRCDFSVVDLPRLMSEASELGIPDRDFFSDHVHLEMRGMRLAMTETAKTLISRTAPEISFDVSSIESAPTPSPNDEALSHLKNAVYCCSWGGKMAGLLRHHLRKALSLDPEIEKTIAQYVDYRTRPAPMALNMGSRGFSDNTGLLNFTDQVRAYEIVNHISEVMNGSSATSEKELIDLWMRSNSIDNLSTIDLLEPHRLYFNAREAVIGRRGFHKVIYERSSFYFGCHAPMDLYFVAVWRFANATPHTAAVKLFINGTLRNELPICEHWQHYNVGLDKSWFQPGVNELELQWPVSAKGLVQRQKEELDKHIRRTGEMGSSLNLVHHFSHLQTLYLGKYHEGQHNL